MYKFLKKVTNNILICIKKIVYAIKTLNNLYN